MEANSFLTPEEIAKIARTTPATVRRWIREGFLPATKLGPRVWRVKRESWTRFMRGDTSRSQLLAESMLGECAVREGQSIEWFDWRHEFDRYVWHLTVGVAAKRRTVPLEQQTLEDSLNDRSVRAQLQERLARWFEQNFASE
jgi:excisionase family DNA binding protein